MIAPKPDLQTRIPALNSGERVNVSDWRPVGYCIHYPDDRLVL